MISAQKRSIELERFKLLLCIAALFFQDDKSLEPIFLQRVIWQHCNVYLPLVFYQDRLQMLDPSGRLIWWHYTKRIAGIWSHVFPYVRRHHPVVRIDMLMAKSRHKLRSYQENLND